MPVLRLGNLEAFDKAIELMPDTMYAAWIGRGYLCYYRGFPKTEVLGKQP
ncbi:MAG: hypothetical protein LBD47_08215 [Treponema sp.]|jgi:hypothetical protein|nr:hypothetical protein [Treponema sp.]